MYMYFQLYISVTLAMAGPIDVGSVYICSTHKESDSGVLEETDPEVNCKFKV